MNIPRLRSELCWNQANRGISVEQNVGIITASIPALRQFIISFRKLRSTQHSHSSEKSFEAGDHLTRSPLHPSTEDMETGHIPSMNSSAGAFTARADTSRQASSGSKSSPTPSVGSPLGHVSLSVEKQHGVEDHPNTRAKASQWKWEERRESRPTLGHPAVLGYSCEIGAGSPKLTA